MASNRQQALPAGTLIDGFEIRRVLGTGGFGVTYLGFDTSLERPVAIKEYCPEGIAVRAEGDTTLSPGDEDLAEAYSYGLTRFLDEARTLARFHHPSIVRVQRFVEANGTGYLIMDFEQGGTLWQLLRRSAPLDEAAVRGVLVPLLEGLEMVHGQSYLHRDIKPSNILMREHGSPVLLDFGAARLALEQQGGALTVLITPGYAPLEQYSATDQQGPWSDLYALGATAFHCMTGTAPMAATERIARLHGGEGDPVPGVLEGASDRYSNLLIENVLWMLEPVAGERPRSTSEVLDALRPGNLTRPASGEPTVAATLLMHDVETGPATVPATDFEPSPALTQGLMSLLEEHAGRVARRVVAPAMERSGCYDDLVEHLAGFVLDPQRQGEFRTRARALRTGDGAGQPDAVASDAASPDAGLPETVTEQARELLAEYVGPIAALLVEQAAGRTSDRDAFHDLLAGELEDDAERREFLSRLK